MKLSLSKAMPRGFIYVLGNPALRGLVKIGQTSRSSEARAQEISSGTGVPAKFFVAYEEEFFDCLEAERLIHARLDEYRESEDREFFRLPIKDAIRVVGQMAKEFSEREQAEIKRIADQGGPAPASGSKGQNEQPGRRIKNDEPKSMVPKVGNRGPKIQTVMRVTATCPSCSACYSVTLKRGEGYATCPSCQTSSRLGIVW